MDSLSLVLLLAAGVSLTEQTFQGRGASEVENGAVRIARQCWQLGGFMSWATSRAEENATVAARDGATDGCGGQ